MTKADEGVAPTSRGAAQFVNPGSSGNVGVAEVTHELIRGQLSEYLDGSLVESERGRVETHLASCQPCTAYWNTFRATVRGVGKLPTPKAPRGMLGRIVEQARRESDAQQ